MMGAGTEGGTDGVVRWIGVGGGGVRILSRARTSLSPGLELLALDTDARELDDCEGICSVRMGRTLLRGLGCGGDPAMGRTAAESDRGLIAEAVGGADLVFLTACLGRGCGSGAAPVVAGLAGETGCPTVAVVSTPFEFEGRGPDKIARETISALRKATDCLIVLPNDLIFQVSDDEDRADRLFASSDEWLLRAVNALVGPIFRPGPLSLDVASFRAALKGGESRAHFSTCRVPAASRPEDVRKALFDCPLRTSGVERTAADRLLVSVGCGGEPTVSAFADLTRAVTGLFDCKEDAKVGLWRDENLGDQIEVTVIARTGIGSEPSRSVGTRGVAVHKSKLAEKKASRTSSAEKQTEFDSLLEHNERGLFGRLEVDAYDGVDLDKPTFLRKGIKIPMPRG